MMNQLKQSWFTLSCLQLSGAISLPVILIGYYLGQHYSYQNCLLELILGNAILFCFAAFYTTVNSHKKMVTIELAQSLFGPSGTLICAAGMVLSLIGWSAIQIHLIATSTKQPYLAGLFAGLLVYFLTCKDLTYLARVNKLLLPLVALSLAYLLSTASQTKLFISPIESQPFKLGLMMVITGGSGLLFDLPTFYRHANTPKDALVSLALIFLLALPLIEGLGMYLATHYANNNNWIQSFINSFNLPSLLFLMLSGLLSTCLNLYSATIVVNRTLGFSYKKTLVACCFISLILAMVNLEHEFSIFLELINLNAEIITVLILVYAGFKGGKFPLPTTKQKMAHQTIFYLASCYALSTKFLKLRFFDDLFLDTAVITAVLLSCYYLASLTQNLYQPLREVKTDGLSKAR